MFYPFAIGLDASGNIFVLNRDEIITEYPAVSAGDVKPTTALDITGNGLTSPTAIAVGRRGAIYVANQRGGNCNEQGCFPTGIDHIAMYRPGSDGDSKTAMIISGPDTGLSSPAGVALDASGNIYVTNANCAETGFIAPFRQTGAVQESCSGSGSITIYASGSNGDAKPVATIAGANTGFGSLSGITVDRNSNIYVLNSGFGAAGAFRFVAGVWYLPGFLSIETGQFFGGLPSILTFKAGSNGDVAPTAIIGGPFTALSGSGIAIGPTGQ